MAAGGGACCASLPGPDVSPQARLSIIVRPIIAGTKGDHPVPRRHPLNRPIYSPAHTMIFLQIMSGWLTRYGRMTRWWVVGVAFTLLNIPILYVLVDVVRIPLTLATI